jgi:hypothetical protein
MTFKVIQKNISKKNELQIFLKSENNLGLRKKYACHEMQSIKLFKISYHYLDEMH